MSVGLNEGDSLLVQNWAVVNRNSAIPVADVQAIFNAIGNPYVGDFTGDGSDDLLGFDSTTQQWNLLQSLNGEFLYSTFAAAASFIPSAYSLTPQVGDFNADGREDLHFKI